eukprot:gene24593-10191_t
MFVEALDIVLQDMKAQDFPFDKVASISGSGQQHGTVYWKNGALQSLQHLSAGASLADQLGNAFSIPNGPIWRDSSTTAECRALEDAMGGAQAVSTITGSRAYERFSGNQIAKIAVEQKAKYVQPNGANLVGLFVLALHFAWQEQKWSADVLNATADGLAAKLEPVVPAHTALGGISQYFIQEYGFAPACRVVAWSGDNPNSVAGLGLRNPGDVGLSLGTSDTIFSIMDAETSSPGLEG